MHGKGRHLTQHTQVHEVEGVLVPELRPATLKAALRGWTNQDEETGRKKRVRQPMTIVHMEMLRVLLRINEPGWSLYHRRLMLTVSVIAFWGAFR